MSHARAGGACICCCKLLTLCSIHPPARGVLMPARLRLLLLFAPVLLLRLLLGMAPPMLLFGLVSELLLLGRALP